MTITNQKKTEWKFTEEDSVRNNSLEMAQWSSCYLSARDLGFNETSVAACVEYGKTLLVTEWVASR